MIILKCKRYNVSCIYLIKDEINNKVYIGSSKNFSKRYREHINCLKTNTHGNPILQNCFNKGHVLSFDILEKCSVESLIERETYYIDFYKSLDRNYGYNICIPSKPPSYENRLKVGYKNNAFKRENVQLKCKIAKYKSVNIFDRNMNLLFTCNSMKEAATITNVSPQCVSQGCREEKYFFNNFTFRYNKQEKNI